MLPKQAISNFISAVNSRIPPPVHTAGIEESRPSPAVLIENVQMEKKNHHNSKFAGSEYDDSGNVVREIFRHYYTLRLELMVRDSDEIQAWDYLGQLQGALDELERRPRALIHEDVNRFSALGSNGVEYQFFEPTETEINQSVLIETFYETDDADVDVIESISDSYNFS